MTRKDRPHAIELLDQHQVRQAMRQGELGQGQDPLGAGAIGIIEAIGISDQKPQLRTPCVASLPATLRKRQRAEELTALVE